MGRAHTPSSDKRKLEMNLNYHKKRKEEISILTKANELLSQEREKSLDEQKVLMLAEQIKAERAKKSDWVKQRRKELLLKIKPEEKKALLFKLAETAKRNHKIKREKEESILSQAVELQDQKREMNSEEKEILRQAEQIKAKKLKRCEDSKRHYHQKRNSVGKEEKEALKQKRIEQHKRLSIEQKKALILEKSKRQKRYWIKYQKREESILAKASALLSQNQELSSDDKEAIRLAEEVKADRLKKLEMRRQHRLRRIASIPAEEKNAFKQKASAKLRQNYEKLLSSMTPEELKCYRLKKTEQAKRYYQERKAKFGFERKFIRLDEMETSNKDEYMNKNASGRLKKDELTSNFPLVFDDIKIEKDVLQESNIKAIAVNPILDIRQEVFGHSSRSWLELSENSFMTGRARRSHRYFQSFHEGHLKKIDRISALEESFHCMRILLDTTTKRYGAILFGDKIAQKLRHCGKDVPEVSIAKQLIDNVLHNLAIGAYSSETKIV